MLPWVYTIVVLVIHIPVVVIRVVRWEIAQNWCLLATFGTIVVQAQAYVSTEFKAEQVLTWTPLLLIIDAGSMAQVVFLILDDFHLLQRLKVAFVFLRRNNFKPLLDVGPWSKRRKPQYTAAQPLGDLEHGGPRLVGSTSDPAQKPVTITEYYTLNNRGSRSSNASTEPNQASRTTQEFPNELLVFKEKPFCIAVLAFLLLITTLVLQIWGLVKAQSALDGAPPDVSWCSPIFQPFSVAVLDGNCNVYPVQQTHNKGVGCILIKGTLQMQWLKATAVGSGISIGLELIDVIILATTKSSKRHRGVKMRRPWCTMIAGLVALGLFLVFGVVYSSTLPAGITQTVWLIVDTGEPSIWSAHLTTAGLRGALIGWNDGVFSGWHQTYFGDWMY